MKRARDIRDQLEGLLERVEIDLKSNPGDLDTIKKCITSGYFSHSKKMQMDLTVPLNIVKLYIYIVAV
nr:pre-mRNA-splicing factor ATP-dependent RNA helicase DEAH1-like isoform X1 [Tanacetum cinerariifolium]